MNHKQGDHSHVKIHPPVLLVIHIFAAFLLNWFLPLPLRFPPVLVWVGYALAAIAIGVAASAAVEFRRARTTLDPHGSVSTMVDSGPYGFSRNPIYLGFVGLLISFSFIFGHYWGLILAPLLMMLLYRLVIQHEEAYLQKRFAAMYTEYLSRVRRWL